MFDKDFKNPRTYSGDRSAIERAARHRTSPASSSTTTPKGDHITRLLDSNDPGYGCPWSHAAWTAGPTASGDALDGRRRPRKSNYDGITLGLTKRWSHNYQFQVNYTLSWDKSDDDNERDPFTLRYVATSTTSRPSTATPTATSATA